VGPDGHALAVLDREAHAVQRADVTVEVPDVAGFENHPGRTAAGRGLATRARSPARPVGGEEDQPVQDPPNSTAASRRTHAGARRWWAMAGQRPP
jgi:hypothetical protein